MNADELEKLLSKLSKTVNAHSMFLMVLVAVFLEDQPGQKQRMIDALKKMKQTPEFASTNYQKSYRFGDARASDRDANDSLIAGWSSIHQSFTALAIRCAPRSLFAVTFVF